MTGERGRLWAEKEWMHIQPANWKEGSSFSSYSATDLPVDLRLTVFAPFARKHPDSCKCKMSDLCHPFFLPWNFGNK